MWKKITMLMMAAVLFCGISINVSAAEGGESGTERRESEVGIMKERTVKQRQYFRQ